MGVRGLWSSISEPAKTQMHLKDFRGKRIAIDVSCWIYRAISANALTFVLDETKPPPCGRNIKPSYRFVWAYIRSRIHLIQKYAATPLLVFDGAPLKAKEKENERRRQSRKVAETETLKYYNEGELLSAEKAARKAVIISSDLKNYIIERLLDEKIVFIVAPYEADAQLARLVSDGVAHAVLTEDSDALAYGCAQVLSSLERTGVVRSVRFLDLATATPILPYRFSLESFQIFCVLAGCDYVRNIKGIGIKKAAGLINSHGSNIERIASVLSTWGKCIDNQYIKSLRIGLLTFKHQTVFSLRLNASPITDHLTKPPKSIDPEAQQLIGPFLDANTAAGVCAGYLDPCSLSPIVSGVRSSINTFLMRLNDCNYQRQISSSISKITQPEVVRQPSRTKEQTHISQNSKTIGETRIEPCTSNCTIIARHLDVSNGISSGPNKRPLPCSYKASNSIRKSTRSSAHQSPSCHSLKIPFRCSHGELELTIRCRNDKSVDEMAQHPYNEFSGLKNKPLGVQDLKCKKSYASSPYSHHGDSNASDCQSVDTKQRTPLPRSLKDRVRTSANSATLEIVSDHTLSHENDHKHCRLFVHGSETSQSALFFGGAPIKRSNCRYMSSECHKTTPFSGLLHHLTNAP